jgi:hypothetical protein
VELKKGASVKLTTDPAFLEKGTAELIFIDYVNICKVVHVNSHVYVDDGLISLIVKEIGMSPQVYNIPSQVVNVLFINRFQEAIISSVKLKMAANWEARRESTCLAPMSICQLFRRRTSLTFSSVLSKELT